MDSKKEQATALFRGGFNCAQAVLAVFCEDYGMDKDLALKTTSGFGGGFRSGELCGAVSGAVSVIGLKYGHCIDGDMDAKSTCNRKTIEFMNLFKQKNKSVVCREILKFDLSIKEEYEQAQNQKLFKTICVNMIESAVELLEDLGY